LSFTEFDFRLAARANWDDVNSKRSLSMKMHLVLAALAAVCSQASFAASEGGDTWSEQQPQPVAGLTQPFATATTEFSTSPQGLSASASEGADTWSELEVRAKATGRSTQLPVVATIAPLSSLRRDDPSPYGTPTQPASADRIVRLSGRLRSVNVAYGETVKFIANDANGAERSFAWRFDVAPALTHVDLSDVAPADLPVQNVRVFVAPDSRYRGG
jgi:hypothetical protein